MVETTIPFKNLAFYEISQHRYVIARILEGKRMRRRPSETRRTTQEKTLCTALCIRLSEQIWFNVIRLLKLLIAASYVLAGRCSTNLLHIIANAGLAHCVKMPLRTK